MCFIKKTYLQPNCKTIVMADFPLQPTKPDVWSVFEYFRPLVNTKVCSETRQSGHSYLNRQVVFGELCYITFDRKKHLPERIVSLRVPFPGPACVFAHT